MIHMLMREQPALIEDVRQRLILLVIFLVFLELSFFVEKLFLNHPTLRRIGRDFEHGPEMLNVLPYEKSSTKGLRRPPPSWV